MQKGCESTYEWASNPGASRQRLGLMNQILNSAGEPAGISSRLDVKMAKETWNRKSEEYRLIPKKMEVGILHEERF